MAITVEAVYENGLLRLSQALPLRDQERVEVMVHSKTNRVDETAGLMGWTGSREELRYFALHPDLDPEESA